MNVTNVPLEYWILTGNIMGQTQTLWVEKTTGMMLYWGIGSTFTFTIVSSNTIKPAISHLRRYNLHPRRFG